MQPTGDVDILPGYLDFVGYGEEDNYSAFCTLFQDTHGKGTGLMKRDCIESGMYTIASCFFQFLNCVGVLVLLKEAVNEF